jgi:hypothetical protein
VLHQHTDCILAHETFEIRNHPHLERCVQNVLTSPDTRIAGEAEDNSIASAMTTTTVDVPAPQHGGTSVLAKSCCAGLDSKG